MYDEYKVEEIVEAKVVEEERKYKEVPKKHKSVKGAMVYGLVTTVIAVSSFGLGGAIYSGELDLGLKTKEVTQSSKEVENESIVQTSKSNSTTGLSVVDIAKVAADSVVEITTETVTTGMRMQQFVSEGAGSGVIISKDGYIVTNNHVINGANKITVRLRNGETYEATLVGKDSQTDLAVIKIEASNLPPVVFGDSDSLEVGEDAVAIGNPLGQLGGTVTSGIISALDREITLDSQTMNLLQTSAAINPGNSGGGLFNDQGELIGVVVAKSAGSDVEGLGFAIPSNDVKSVVDEIISHGYVTGRPVLGISVLSVDSIQAAYSYGLSQMGVYVADLTAGTYSEESGMKVGDYIVAIDDQQVSTTADISKILQDKAVGDKVQVTVSREGKMMTLDVKLSESKPASN